uniref:GTP_EFTU_D3 domain-containing protein n=1 Tax=Macrostomum lignano TaxID=282301 RepID=A0A1I8FNM9_9PLAT
PLPSPASSCPRRRVEKYRFKRRRRLRRRRIVRPLVRRRAGLRRVAATANAYLFVRDKDTGGRITQPPLPDVKRSHPQSAAGATNGGAFTVLRLDGAQRQSWFCRRRSRLAIRPLRLRLGYSRLNSSSSSRPLVAPATPSSASPAPLEKNGADPDSAGGAIRPKLPAASAAAAAEPTKRSAAQGRQAQLPIRLGPRRKRRGGANAASQMDVARSQLKHASPAKAKFESGFDQGGQTREHALLARGLGIGQLVPSTRWTRPNGPRLDFAEIRDKLGVYLKSVGLSRTALAIVPCLAWRGPISISPCQLNCVPGPTLVDLIDRLTPPARSVDKPLRFYISEVSTGVGRRRRLRRGGLLSATHCRATRLQRSGCFRGFWFGHLCRRFRHYQRFRGWRRSGSLRPGSVLSSVTTPCPCTNRLRAKLLLLNVSQPGYQAIFHQQAVSVPVTIIRLLAQINKSTGQLERRHPRYILSNCCAEVELQLDRPLCLDVYTNSRELGKFMLRDRGVTVAAGTVVLCGQPIRVNQICDLHVYCYFVYFLHRY